MAQTKTDNAFLEDKISIRSNNIPKKVTVLDCFAVEGLIWNGVRALNPDKTIKVLSIEKEKGKGGFHLVGDNTRYLRVLNLSPYNVVDLDAYGVPYDQLSILFDRKYHGLIFFTFIQSFMGQLPHGMMLEIGYSKTMLEKAPALCCRHGWESFTQYLALHGVKEITYINHQRKYYGFFSL